MNASLDITLVTMFTLKRNVEVFEIPLWKSHTLCFQL